MSNFGSTTTSFGITCFLNDVESCIWTLFKEMIPILYGIIVKMRIKYRYIELEW